RIICCRRDPLETCVSCYRQHLDNNEYARTFTDLAAYWRDFDRSAGRWQALHPAHVHQHVYEELIAEPEKSIRALLEFCGLPFEEGCLRFHEAQRDAGAPTPARRHGPCAAVRCAARSVACGAGAPAVRGVIHAARRELRAGMVGTCAHAGAAWRSHRRGNGGVTRIAEVPAILRTAPDLGRHLQPDPTRA